MRVVKQVARDLEYPVIQPMSLKTDDFADQIKSLKPDFQVVIAYGKILPENVLAIPRIGTINIHASLLPKLRGAAPIQWAVTVTLKREYAQCVWIREWIPETFC